MTETILKIAGMSGGYEKGKPVLEDIGLEVQSGEALGVLGLNGSGKSTFGKMIMNMLPYRSGDIFYDGSLANGKLTWELAKSGMTMMHQGGVIFEDLTVWENLRMASEGRDDTIMQLLKTKVPLLARPGRELRKMKAGNLSGGERHELAMAMTFAQKPHLVILDEPSAGLSPAAMDSTFLLLEVIRKMFGTTIILIEQNISRACRFCDRCVLIEHKEIKKTFSRSELESNNIEEILFNGK